MSLTHLTISLEATIIQAKLLDQVVVIPLTSSLSEGPMDPYVLYVQLISEQSHTVDQSQSILIAINDKCLNTS